MQFWINNIFVLRKNTYIAYTLGLEICVVFVNTEKKKKSKIFIIYFLLCKSEKKKILLLVILLPVISSLAIALNEMKAYRNEDIFSKINFLLKSLNMKVNTFRYEFIL